MVVRTNSKDISVQTDIVKRITGVFQFDYKLFVEVDPYTGKFHHYFADFIQYGKLISCVIVKRRYNDLDKYPTWMLGEEQFIEADKLAKQQGVRLWAAVQFNDGIHFTRLTGNEHKWRRAMGRTNEPGREVDRKFEEMCRYVPITDFRPLPESWSWERGGPPSSRTDIGRGADTFL